MRLWGISRSSRHLKRRLTTQTGEVSPAGEIARAYVRCVGNPRKMRGGLCPRVEACQSGIIARSRWPVLSQSAGPIGC